MMTSAFCGCVAVPEFDDGPACLALSALSAAARSPAAAAAAARSAVYKNNVFIHSPVLSN